MAGNKFLMCVRVILSLTLSIPFALYPAVPAQAAGAVIHVAEGGAGDETCGNNWTNPCDLQYALQTRAVSGDQVWVKAGTYYPTVDGTNRSASFQIKDGIKVYGGFDGTELSLPDRAGLFSQTILSGDIDRETFPDIASPATDAGQIRGANSLHVVTLSGVSEDTIFDGFTVTAGQADVPNPGNMGGGVLVYNGVPILSNLIVVGNKAEYGGGIVVWENDHDPISWSTQPVLAYLYISGNEAFLGGGAAFGGIGSPYYDICGTMENVTITKNSAETGYGGGLHSAGCKDLRLTNVTITENFASNGGGFFDQFSNITMNHVTISRNTVINQAEEFLTLAGTAKVYSSIIWCSNPNVFYEVKDGSLDFTYSDIRQPEGTVFPGEGNINEDPLLGILGDHGGSTPTLSLLPGSPAINTADLDHCPAFDQRGVVRPQEIGCDMGAYEARPFSMTPGIGNVQSTPILADFVHPLEVNVVSEHGDPVDGGQVTFVTPAQGASAVLSSNPVKIAGGKASVTATANEVIGEYTVTANLRGLQPVSFHLTNLKWQTTISLSSLHNPSVVGQRLDITATVNTAGPSIEPVTEGTITFYDGTTILGSGTPDENGQLSFISMNGLSVGKHDLSAVFSGSENFEQSGPAKLEQTVDRAETLVSLISSLTPSKVGQEVTFTATVTVQSPGSGDPTGQISFIEPASGISYDVPLNGSTATLTLRNLPVGSHTLNARYQGDVNFSASTSDWLIHVVIDQQIYLPVISCISS